MAGNVSQIRRLAAILSADVAGYSRLIEVDEEGPTRAASSATSAQADLTFRDQCVMDQNQGVVAQLQFNDKPLRRAAIRVAVTVKASLSLQRAWIDPYSVPNATQEAFW
jgi:hypothetical protein